MLLVAAFRRFARIFRAGVSPSMRVLPPLFCGSYYSYNNNNIYNKGKDGASRPMVSNRVSGQSSQSSSRFMPLGLPAS